MIKAALEWIRDMWWLAWRKEFRLLDRPDLGVLVYVHRWTGKTSTTVLTGIPTQLEGVYRFQIYEVDDVSMIGHDQLVRIMEHPGGPSRGQLIVWLWQQGVSTPRDAFTGTRQT